MSKEAVIIMVVLAPISLVIIVALIRGYSIHLRLSKEKEDE